MLKCQKLYHFTENVLNQLKKPKCQLEFNLFHLKCNKKTFRASRVFVRVSVSVFMSFVVVFSLFLLSFNKIHTVPRISGEE